MRSVGETADDEEAEADYRRGRKKAVGRSRNIEETAEESIEEPKGWTTKSMKDSEWRKSGKGNTNRGE